VMIRWLGFSSKMRVVGSFVRGGEFRLPLSSECGTPKTVTARFLEPGFRDWGSGYRNEGVQGYLAHTKTPLPWDLHRALGSGPLRVPRKMRFLTYEIHL